MRLDQWLWAVRVYKTRSISADAIKGGHVKVNGERTKPAHEPKPGELITARVDIMTRTVSTCGEADSINEVMEKMTTGRFRHLPVITNGRLVGIVSIGDVVKARIREVERDAADLRSYIASA